MNVNYSWKYTDPKTEMEIDEMIKIISVDIMFLMRYQQITPVLFIFQL